jgi:hypothetical protein
LIDAMNLRITDDPGTDSIDVATGVGQATAMELDSR